MLVVRDMIRLHQDIFHLKTCNFRRQAACVRKCKYLLAHAMQYMPSTRVSTLLIFSRVRGQRLVILEAICQILSWKFPALLGL